MKRCTYPNRFYHVDLFVFELLFWTVFNLIDVNICLWLLCSDLIGIQRVCLAVIVGVAIEIGLSTEVYYLRTKIFNLNFREISALIVVLSHFENFLKSEVN